MPATSTLQPEMWRAQPEPELMTLSEAVFQDDGYVATQVFPNVPVRTTRGTYGKIERASHAIDDLQPHEPGANTEIGTLETGAGIFNTQAFRKGIAISEEADYNASASLNPEEAIMRALVEQAMNRREKRWVDRYFRRNIVGGSTSVWANVRTGIDNDTAVRGTSVTQWNRPNAVPIDDVYEAKHIVRRNGGKALNTLICSDAVFYQLARNASVLELITGGANNMDPAHVMPNQLAQVMRLSRVIIGEASYNTAKPGDSAVYSGFLGKHALLLHVPDRPGIYTPAAGYHFSWTGFRGMANMSMDSMNYGHYLDSYWDEDRTFDIIRIRMRDDPQLTNRELGYFIENVIA